MELAEHELVLAGPASADPTASVRAAIAAESKAEEEKAQKAKEASAWIAHKAADGQVCYAPDSKTILEYPVWTWPVQWSLWLYGSIPTTFDEGMRFSLWLSTVPFIVQPRGRGGTSALQTSG